MLFKQNIQTAPFKLWILKNPENILVLKVSAVVILINFFVFKFLYPFPNFMPPDSNSYLEAAFYNQTINVWAIGYSKFLRLVSSFSNSHWVLVWIQYLLLQTCLLYFLYSLHYLLTLGKWTFRLIVACGVLNPLLPHVSNFVSSDGVFTALSLLWFTQLLWIIYRPERRLLIFHAFVLLSVFMVRYNALFYPFISIMVVWLANWPFREKLINIGLIVLLLGAFIGRTEYKYYTYTGYAQYSAFGGWQMAANALYGYAYATPDAPEKVPIEFRQLHLLVNNHMDSLRSLNLRPDREVAIYYLWDEKAPLKTYLRERSSGDTTVPFFKRWATIAPLYAAYGRYLIRKHPLAFIRHYVWPNFIKYYAPPTKFMGVYNLEEDTVDPMVVRWFGWSDNKIFSRYGNTKIGITEPFTILMAVTNLIFIFSLIGFTFLHGFRRTTTYSKRMICWVFAIWLSNMVFSVLSAPIELRYQIFPMIITFSFSILLIECMIGEVASEEENIYTQY